MVMPSLFNVLREFASFHFTSIAISRLSISKIEIQVRVKKDSFFTSVKTIGDLMNLKRNVHISFYNGHLLLYKKRHKLKVQNMDRIKKTIFGLNSHLITIETLIIVRNIKDVRWICYFLFYYEVLDVAFLIWLPGGIGNPFTNMGQSSDWLGYQLEEDLNSKKTTPRIGGCVQIQVSGKVVIMESLSELGLENYQKNKNKKKSIKKEDKFFYHFLLNIKKRFKSNLEQCKFYVFKDHSILNKQKVWGFSVPLEFFKSWVWKANEIIIYSVERKTLPFLLNIDDRLENMLKEE